MIRRPKIFADLLRSLDEASGPRGDADHPGDPSRSFLTDRTFRPVLPRAIHFADEACASCALAAFEVTLHR